MKLAIVGYASCGYFQRAAQAVTRAAAQGKLAQPAITQFDTRAEYQQWLDTDQKHPRGTNHRTSPFVYNVDTGVFVGGHDDTMTLLASKL